MKSIMLSIQPKWVYKILNNEKGMPFPLDNVDESIDKEKIEKVWKRLCKKLRHEEQMRLNKLLGAIKCFHKTTRKKIKRRKL